MLRQRQLMAQPLEETQFNNKVNLININDDSGKYSPHLYFLKGNRQNHAHAQMSSFNFLPQT